MDMPTFKRISDLIELRFYHDSEKKLVKQFIQSHYSYFGTVYPDQVFLNYGLLDKNIQEEMQHLDFKFSSLYDFEDNFSPSLLYYLIRPLIKIQFFHKRLLDIGCGNGFGVKASSELLKTNYALGVDLVHRLTKNANKHFFKPGQINYIQADSEHLPLENESFDIITNLESSHLYPQIEDFFSEVERILTVNGFFCYADLNHPYKAQAHKFEAFLKQNKKLKIIQKVNITKLVQAALYQRLIVNEEEFYKNAQILVDNDVRKLRILIEIWGLIFLPWWKIRFKNPALKEIARLARRSKFWGKKYYFYYVVQKIKK
jgi:ubiquinone/menaquinone biosynthesis C-methylase UbiE